MGLEAVYPSGQLYVFETDLEYAKEISGDVAYAIGVVFVGLSCFITTKYRKECCYRKKVRTTDTLLVGENTELGKV